MDAPNLRHPAAFRPELDLVAEVLEHGVGEPLSALRATLDSLVRHGGTPGNTTIAEAALAQIVELSRTVHDLSDFAAPPPLKPMRCSVAEIVTGALADLEPALRPQVLLVVEDRTRTLMVDGPVLSHCLAHLITDGLQQDAECMLHVRQQGEITQFVVVHTPPLAAEATHSPLRRAMAQRDLGRMGASLTFHVTSRTSTVVVDGWTEAEQAEAAA